MSKKKGLFDRIANTSVGGIIFSSDEPVESGAQNSPPSPTSSAFASTPFAPSFGQSLTSPAAPMATVDPEIKTKLEQVVASAPNQRSFLEFSRILTSLGQVLTEESQRYRAALVSANATGHTKTHVLQAISAILDALDTHSREFQAAAPQKIAELVGARQAELARIEENLKNKKAEMTRLQQEISQLEADRSVSAAAIDTERKRVEEKVSRFNGTFATMRRTYETEREKINRYGEGV